MTFGGKSCDRDLRPCSVSSARGDEQPFSGNEEKPSESDISTAHTRVMGSWLISVSWIFLFPKVAMNIVDLCNRRKQCRNSPTGLERPAARWPGQAAVGGLGTDSPPVPGTRHTPRLVPPALLGEPTASPTRGALGEPWVIPGPRPWLVSALWGPERQAEPGSSLADPTPWGLPQPHLQASELGRGAGSEGRAFFPSSSLSSPSLTLPPVQCLLHTLPPAKAGRRVAAHSN